MTLAFCPPFDTIEEAVTWFEERGYSRVYLWRGPDGLVRGSGLK